MTTLIAAGVVIAGLYFGRDILVPLALAVLLSFLLAPLLRWLRRLRIGRGPSVALTVLVGFLVIGGFGAVVAHELAALADRLPVYEENIRAKIGSLPGELPGSAAASRIRSMMQDLRSQLARAGNLGAARPASGSGEERPPQPVVIRAPPATPLETVENLLGPLLGPLATAGLVAVLVIWILLNREELRDRLLGLGGADLHRTTLAMNDAALRVGNYLTRQLLVNAGCALPIGIGLAAIGIPYASLWALFVVVLRFLPFLGIVIAASFPVALVLAVAPGWSLVIWTVALLVGVETVVANLVEPRLYGASTGLSPLALIVAAVFWTWLWGPVGLLLSTPLTACLVVLGRHVPQLAFLELLFGSDAVLSPEQTFYQRLLAGDPLEASEQAEQFAKQGPLAEFFDTVALPALALAQADSDRGSLPPERRALVAEGVRAMLDDLNEDGEPADTDNPPVPCVAARNELDEAAAALLSRLLQDEMRPAPVLPAAALADSGPDQPALARATLVCLSLVDAGSPSRARFLVRRLRRRAPRARLVVGLWGEAGDLPGFAATIGLGASDVLVTSLRDALSIIIGVPAARTEEQPAISA
jgi:predicted PurR-regulated permease PerM